MPIAYHGLCLKKTLNKHDVSKQHNYVAKTIKSMAQRKTACNSIANALGLLQPCAKPPNVLLMWYNHDDVIKWKHFPRYWLFVGGIHRWPVNSPHKGQWRGALMFSLICARIKDWVNNREAGDLRRHRSLSKQSWGWWFETPSLSLWRHFNDNTVSFFPNYWQQWAGMIYWCTYVGELHHH